MIIIQFALLTSLKSYNDSFTILRKLLFHLLFI